MLVVNKLDTFDVSATYEFYSLGLGEPMPISCAQSKGLGDVLDKVISYFPENLKVEEENGIKISLVGRPNVGKSSLINRLLGKKRLVVSEENIITAKFHSASVNKCEIFSRPRCVGKLEDRMSAKVRLSIVYLVKSDWL